MKTSAWFANLRLLPCSPKSSLPIRESEALSKWRNSLILIASNTMPQRVSSFGKVSAFFFRTARASTDESLLILRVDFDGESQPIFHLGSLVSSSKPHDNTQLLARPPDIHPSEYSLPREDRVHLARLRYGQHPALLSYQKRLDGSIADACPGCNTTPNTIKHIMEDCTVRNHTHQQHNIHSMKAPWESPVQAMTYLRSLGLFGHLA
ncbi:hypothetical protein GWK47_006389 [Chionoecetes opilio]|uniref:Uncharacterized protein n=1 Tax=Chionoecetes opilio TaxID=41210 RepID=A0A8J4Y751_CHIOP|nr:hypothetical protein GWK47_006389 [Chionoecetes opilio]